MNMGTRTLQGLSYNILRTHTAQRYACFFITIIVFNFFSHFSRHRVRLPRHFGANKVLVPYSHDKAFRQFAVSSTCNARYSNEHCSYHVIEGDRLYLVTDNRVLCVRVDTLELVWKVSFKSKFQPFDFLLLL